MFTYTPNLNHLNHLFFSLFVNISIFPRKLRILSLGSVVCIFVTLYFFCMQSYRKRKHWKIIQLHYGKPSNHLLPWSTEYVLCIFIRSSFYNFLFCFLYFSIKMILSLLNLLLEKSGFTEVQNLSYNIFVLRFQ